MKFSAIAVVSIARNRADTKPQFWAGGAFGGGSTGLHYNWHRSYDPTLGRYTQADPLGFPDGPSRYAYAVNSPQMFVDPEGRAVPAALVLLMTPEAAGAAMTAIAGLTTGWCIGGLILENRKSEKEKASDIPSWAKGERPRPGESGREFADRLLDKKYGQGNYGKGPGSEHNKVKKYGDRSKRWIEVSKCSSVYILWHIRQIGDEDEEKLLGVYSTNQGAVDAQNRYLRLPGFEEGDGEFVIDEYQLNVDAWPEGFVTVKS